MLNYSVQVVSQPGQNVEHLDKDSATQPNGIDSVCQVCVTDQTKVTSPR